MSALTPSRKGRCAGSGSWQQQYQSLRMTADEAAQLIQDGDNISTPAASNWPYAVDAALAARLRNIGGRVELNTLFLPLDTALLAPENTDLVDYHSIFYFKDRALQDQGNVHFVPINLSATGPCFVSRNPRVVVITCSAPDENGWMSRSLWGAHIHRQVLEQAEVVIAEVNDQLPYLPSDGDGHMLVHVSEVDAIVENSIPPAESRSLPVDEIDKAVAGHIAEMVPNGACLQFGLGGLANAVGECLAYAGKRDLGIHSEALSGCVVELMERGVINNSRKQTCTGRTAGAFFIGDRRLWEFAKNNPLFCQKEVEWINDPRNIARNDQVVSINNAMEIDLTGQVNSESVGSRQYSGTGGQLEWVIGSQWSKGGKSIIAMRSSYRDKNGVLHSKIKPQLPLGSVVTTPRTWVQYVVTEYGVADLKYKNTRERAKALIAIAHPDFREELSRNLPL